VDASATLRRWPNNLYFIIYIGKKKVNPHPQYQAEWYGLKHFREIDEEVKGKAWEQLQGLDPGFARLLKSALKRLGPEARQKVLDDMKKRLGLRCDGEEQCIEEAVKRALEDVKKRFKVISHIALTNERVEKVKVDEKSAREILSVLYEMGRGDREFAKFLLKALIGDGTIERRGKSLEVLLTWGAAAR
jgi:hypothetical protein